MKKIVQNVFLGLLLVIMSLSALAGIAAAVWSAVGGGSKTAGTGTTVAVTLTPGAPTAGLYPGGQSDVVLTVTSSNPGPVRIGSLSTDLARGTSGFGVDTNHAGCAVSALVFTTQTNGTTGWTVPAKAGSVDGTLAITLPNAVTMSPGAANACQGGVFTVYLVAAP